MANKYCTKCGAEIPDGAKFCPKCGAPVLPDDDNLMDATRIVEKQNTTDIPRFNQTENTQEIHTQPQQTYYSQNQENTPYNNPDYTDNEEYEEPKRHYTWLIILIVVAALVCLISFLLFSGVLENVLPGHNNETAAETETAAATSKPEKKEKNEDSKEEALPEKSSKPSATPTSGVLKTTNEDSQPVSKTQKGTVFVSSDVNGPQRIKVRTGPSLSATDTNERKYDGDSVTVYETKKAEGYTWYRIGDNQWIASDGSNFGVNLK